jgi:TPR repeat protein
MQGFTPTARLAEHQRPPFADLWRLLTEMKFDQSALSRSADQAVAIMEQVCQDADDHGRLVDELVEWVRWIRAPAYCLTYTYQLLTQRQRNPRHVLAALMFSDAQIGVAEDRSLDSLEVAWNTTNLIDAQDETLAARLGDVKKEIVRRLRAQHQFYAKWTRPFDYAECNPLAAHLYNERVRDSLSEAYGHAAVSLRSNEPAERQTSLREIEREANQSGDVYHRLVARRLAALETSGVGDYADAQLELAECIRDAYECGLEAEVGHLLRQRAAALMEIGELAEAEAELKRAIGHEQPIAMFGYWYGLTACELGDVRLLRMINEPGGRDAWLEPAIDAYGVGRRALDLFLHAGGPPAAATIKRQMVRSYRDNALGVALLGERIADTLAEVEANGPRGISDTMAEIRAAGALPAGDGAEFLRAREVFHRHLTSVPRDFDQYLAELPGEHVARHLYEKSRQSMRTIGRRDSDEVAERLLARGDDMLVLAFHLGPAVTNRALLFDLADGTVDERVLGAREHTLRAAHAEYVRALVDASETPDPGRAVQRALDGFLNATLTVVRPALEMVAAKGVGRKLVVVPKMQLNAVPMHALAVDGAQLVDLVRDLAFVPSLSLLVDLLEAPEPTSDTPARVTGIHDNARTPFFSGTFHQLSETRTVNVVSDPEPAAALRTLESAAGDDVLFACHGVFDALNPAASVLAIGTGTGLSLSTLSGQIALPQCRCVLLGACESGLARAEIPSEYIGLAGVLLSAGVRNVVASLWKVGQLPTAILLGDCLQRLGAGTELPRALIEAQRHIRGLGRDAIVEWITAHVPTLLRRLERQLELLPPLPFAHPMYWAGFFAASRGALGCDSPPPLSTAAQTLLTAEGDRRPTIDDQVLDHDQTDSPRVIRDDVGKAVLATADPTDQFNIGVAAYDAGRPDIAQGAMEPLAQAGDTNAMNNLAVLLQDSHPEAARDWLEKAASRGNIGAMANLGALLKDTEPEAARDWLERAALSGDTGAMYNLAVVLQDCDPPAARGWYEKAANGGNTDAMYNLGWLLNGGDPQAARDWWEQAANGGNTSAMYNLGVLLYDSDPKASRHWLEKAANDGNTSAMDILGATLRDSDPQAARNWYEKAANGGNTSAMYHLGTLLQDSDPQAARDWLEKAANDGNTDAMYNLGRLLHGGDPQAARDWWEKSANGGNTSAMNHLGVLLKGSDPRAAQAWYEKAANGGNTDAMYNLAALLHDSDSRASRDWLEKSANGGNTFAMYHLGTLLQDSDPQAARDWLETSANGGNTFAMNHLGTLLQDTNPQAARDWWEKAANGGSLDAMNHLGVVLQDSDPQAARDWWEKAANRGSTSAMNHLGVLLQDSEPQAARDWYEEAANGGNTFAMYHLGVLLQDSDPQAARDWLEGAANGGSIFAMYHLGGLLHDSDPQTARDWWEKAAKGGHVDAMNDLGVLLQDSDPQAARGWWEQAANGGDTFAMYNLGALLQDSDPQAARDWLENAASAGNALAMNHLGVLLHDTDPQAAREWYENAANAGDTNAMYNLGALLQDSDPKAARDWLQ